MSIRDDAQNLQAEAADLDRMLDSLWPASVPHCRHKHATMVQATNSDGAWFVTWQCDNCGAPLRDRPVTADDLEQGAHLPWFDADLLQRHIKQIEQRPAAVQAFFGKAAQR